MTLSYTLARRITLTNDLVACASARATNGPANAAPPTKAITLLLLMFVIVHKPFCRFRAQQLRIGFLVPRVVDLEEHHHRVIFVHDVVAVDGYRPTKSRNRKNISASMLCSSLSTSLRPA